MPRTVAQLTSLDVYRDGGSLSASFLDDEGINCTLLFPIHLVAQGQRKFERLGYLPPILEIYRKVERISPITGLSSFDSNKEVEFLSWEVARKILQQWEPFVDGFITDYASVYPAMLEIAKTEGHTNESA